MVAFEDLRIALLDLDPTGPDGFEGLLATILGAIAGQPFRLAHSGLQHGRDGETLVSSSHISFEGKLYTDTLSKNEVLSKITQLIGSAIIPDVWVLGATVEVRSQLASTVQAAATSSGIGVLILDWPETSAYPPLAVACAMAQDQTIQFLQSHITDPNLIQQVRIALEMIRASDGFGEQTEAIRAEVRASSLGLANARTANEKWLTERFADRARARATFGQALSLMAPGPLQRRSRVSLNKEVKSHLLATPSRSILAIIGREGRGKTWLLVESWLEMAEKPLTLLVPAADMKAVAVYGEFLPFLIGKIIQQTGDIATDKTRQKWNRRLKAWENELAETPRFILCIDGLNQHPNFEWPRWLDDAATNVALYGGALVVTARQIFHEERLRYSLHTPIKTVTVPEWTSWELDEILQTRSIQPSQVARPVYDRLRNPRILSIAFDLLDAVQIENFAELSVERLLFEYIRAGAREGTAPEGPDPFVRRLAQHAQEIIDRTKDQKIEDRLVFDQQSGSGRYLLTSDLLAVTAEHFFHPLPEDSTLYTLSNDGLSLALGLALIKALQVAERSAMDPGERLAELLEPISALDKTANAVFSALMAASVDDRCSSSLMKALFEGFLSLQNIDEQFYPPFVGVVRNATAPAIEALGEISTSDVYIASKDWLTSALRELRRVPKCWETITAAIDRWLRHYSLEPEIGVFAQHEGQEKYERKKADRVIVLEGRTSALSAAERTFLDQKMIQIKGFDPSPLHQEALELMVSMPLASFAEPLVAAAISGALNSGLHNPHDEYVALVRFNRRDWEDTRIRLLEAADFLFAETVSPAGKWAAVRILRAISRDEDARKAHRLVEELTADREKFEGWRLVETYSASDPCDPHSPRPDNIDRTGERYAAIDVKELTKSLSMGQEDHFFRDARPGLARFAHVVAISKLREYARSMVARSGVVQRLGITSLEPHSAALDRETIAQLLRVIKSLSSPRDLEVKESREDWIASQYGLQVCFTHLDGEQQLEFLSSLPPHGPPLLKFADVVKPASAATMQAALELVASTNDHCQTLAVLMFARHSGTPLNGEARNIIGRFVRDNQSSTRALALAIIARLDDKCLIQQVVDDGWALAVLEPEKHTFEHWYGSLVMIAAARHGILGIHNTLDQITSKLYGRAAEVLGAEVGAEVAVRLQWAVRRALEIEIPHVPPSVKQRLVDDNDQAPPLLEMIEPQTKKGIEAFFKRLNESDEEFDARQKSYWKSFEIFARSLTQQQASIIIEDIGTSAIRVMIEASREDIKGLAEVILAQDQRKLYRITNFALRLAKGISDFNPALAKKLFDQFSGQMGIVKLTSGAASISLEALTIWSSAQHEALDDLRTTRLDNAASDYELAQEVLAALHAGREDFLVRYARMKLQSLVPADNARAVLVLGFGLESEFADEVLKRPQYHEGLIGQALEAANYAYSRNRWSKHWYAIMAATNSAEEFWRLSVLLLKIVDGRFDIWCKDVPQQGSAIQRFGVTIDDQLRKRADAWKSHREKTLCGAKAPSPVFTVADV